MPHHGDGEATEERIHDATRNTLKKADELGAKSLVIPALGCGVAGFETEAGAQIICSVLDEYEPASLSDVRFIGYSDEEVTTIREVTAEVRES